MQTHLLLHGRMQYDFIGKFEKFDADMATVLQRLTISNEYFIRERRDETRAETLLSGFYDDRSVKAVREIFAADFAAFGYEGELPG